MTKEDKLFRTAVLQSLRIIMRMIKDIAVYTIGDRFSYKWSDSLDCFDKCIEEHFDLIKGE